MSSADALTALGSDLTFSVSYAIASELRLSAGAAGFSDHELIAIMLVVSIVLSAAPATLNRAMKMGYRDWPRWKASLQACGLGWLATCIVGVASANAREIEPRVDKGMRVGVDDRVLRSTPSLVQFVELLIGIARRISLTLLIQLVAATAVSNQSLRIVRVLSLLSVAVFFLFLQSGASTVAPRA